MSRLLFCEMIRFYRNFVTIPYVSLLPIYWVLDSPYTWFYIKTPIFRISQICRCQIVHLINLFFCIYVTFLSNFSFDLPGSNCILLYHVFLTRDTENLTMIILAKQEKNTLFGRLYNKNSPRNSLYFNSNSIYCCLFLLLICVRLLYLVDLTSLSELHFQRTNSKARRILT